MVPHNLHQRYNRQYAAHHQEQRAERLEALCEPLAQPPAVAAQVVHRTDDNAARHDDHDGFVEYHIHCSEKPPCIHHHTINLQ